MIVRPVNSGSLRSVSRTRGFALLLAGWVLSVVGLELTLGTFLYLGFSGQQLTWEYYPLFGGMFAGGAVIHYGQQARLTGRRHLTRIANYPGADESFVLYLRSFRDDVENVALGDGPVRPEAFDPLTHVGRLFFSGRSMEEHLIACLRDLGAPVIAVGRPGERLPPAGAQRLYLPRDDWKRPVLDLMSRARLVVIALDASPGTLWEFVEATRLVEPRRLLLVAPGKKLVYEHFRTQATKALDERAQRIQREAGKRWSPPKLPEFGRPPSRPATIGGLISYSPSWNLTFTSLTPFPLYDVLHATLRRSVHPTLERLIAYEEKLPQARASWVTRRKRIAEVLSTMALLFIGYGVVQVYLCAKHLAGMNWDLAHADSQWWTNAASAAVALVSGSGTRMLMRKTRLQIDPRQRAGVPRKTHHEGP
jgi:hypothetical protein